ncbi:OTU domain-containing protein 6B-like [Carica papaya]|uniref:OTU domain-containing protein 6B-like n=1 Tax=Carica papaya TaxID=3649 RepID=UPI000B8D1AB0|nr:OTU domain-containing protein 6B-like [Carica papaya]
MLGILCARPKPWILNSLSLITHGSAAHHHLHSYHQSRFLQTPIHFGELADKNRRRHHSTACNLAGSVGGVASIWHAILPSAGGSGGSGLQCCRRLRRIHERKGEGSWNVLWDARPARWLHPPDSAWLLFGVCACLAPINWTEEKNDEVAVEEKIESSDLSCAASDDKIPESCPDYKVTGVLADGRCLFRAIAHGACLRNGEEAPDENHQRQLADELRTKVVDELLKRREETEWFIEGDFDAYVKEIQQPYVWGGEPELLMASHVLKTLISVFMKDRSSGKLVSIANYGQDYQKDNESPINVLFHGYGHYDLLETFS